jgi:hypothetical protein
MAVRAILTRVPLEIFEAIKVSGSFIPSDEVLGKKYDWKNFGRIGIDTTWDTLHSIFRNAAHPLAYALEGDYHPEGGLQFFSETDDGTSYLAYASPGLVQEVAEALAKFPIKQELSKLENDIQYLSYCLDYFNDLVSFYWEAARKDEAVFISIN